MNMKSAEEVYESFLRKNLIISSSFDQISRHRLDSDGQRNRMTLTAFTIFGGLLQVVQVSALFLPEREGKMLRNYSGDYLSAVGISGTALSVILAVIIIHAITDRICYAMTEAAGFPALTIIQTFRTKLSRDAGSKFEQYLQQVNRLEGVADFMFYSFHDCTACRHHRLLRLDREKRTLCLFERLVADYVHDFAEELHHDVPRLTDHLTAGH